MATGQTHGGKGSTTRPTDRKKYATAFDAIFADNKKKDKDKQDKEKKQDAVKK